MARQARVQTVTTAARSRFEEIDARTRRYTIGMGIRTLSVALALFVFSGPARWIALAIGFVLPMISVTAANTPNVVRAPDPELAGPERPRELPTGGPVIDA